MLRDLRKPKGSRELSATLIEILFSSDNLNVSYTVFSLWMSDSLVKYEIQQCLCFIAPPAHNFTKDTITCRLVIPLLNTANKQSVPSQILFPINFGFVASF